MKKLLFLITMMLVSVIVNAQHTLSFNQVLLVNSTQQTVLPGHVWKITGVFYSSQVPDPMCNSSTSCFSITAFNDVIKVGGVNITIRSVRSAGSYSSVSTYLWEEHFPNWLPENTTLQASTGVSSISVTDFIVQ